MHSHYLDFLLILEAVFGVHSEPFKNVENIFSVTLNCLLNQKFHSAHFSTVGLVNKEVFLLQKHIFFVPFSYFKPSLTAISVSVFCVRVPIPDSFVLLLALLSFPLHLQTSWSKVLFLAPADPLGIVCLE